jgi:hypothetical protein
MKALRSQSGLTLIELLVAVPMAALVVAAASAATFQILASGDAGNYVRAYREVQTAGYWLSRDGVQAQAVADGPNNGFPLSLEWSEWSGTEHDITYDLQDMPTGDLKYLRRQESVNGEPPATMTVARYVSATETSVTWDAGEGVLNLAIEAHVGEQTAARSYRIKPRPFA